MKPSDLTMVQALHLLTTGELRAVDLVHSCLERIEHTDKSLKAFITVDAKGAMEQAEKADQLRKTGEPVGRLCGIPVSIKDLLCTDGLQTTCGSRMLAKFVPPYDATVVSRLRNEGAVIIGKTTMDEFAMGSTSETCAFGVPQNPWKKGYVAGGSSGGSAVSIAARQCPASLGSDTGGSIRQPASLCGVVGMKPTYGRVSRYGLTAFASSLDQVGPLTRTVEDCALLMNVICGYDPMDSTAAQHPVPDYTTSLVEGMHNLTVGIPQEYFGEGIDPEVADIIGNAIEVLKDAGARTVDVSLPHTDYCVAAYYLIAPSEASSNLARYDGALYGFRHQQGDSLLDMYKKTRSAGFGPEVKRRILIGTYALSSGYYDAYYRKASQVRTLILEDFRRALEQCDILVSPVCPTPAWKIGEKMDDPLAMYMTDILTLSANLAGVPGMSVPGGITTEGLPVGVQLQAAHFNEEVLIKTAFNLERSLQMGTPHLDL